MVSRRAAPTAPPGYPAPSPRKSAAVFKKVRIAVLLLILINVAVGTWLARVRTTSWDRTLRVAVFPIAGDGSLATAGYLSGLSREDYRDVEAFFATEARRHGLALPIPVEVRLAPRVASCPPTPPFGGSTPEVVVWSLRMRWWAWRHGEVAGPKPHVRIFAVHHDPKLRITAPHSLGIEKGQIGVVHVFASREQAAQNQVVLAHELLHTVGASDKYDPGTNQPRFPHGYGDPSQTPLYPQRYAEIMGGRTVLSPTRAKMPADLEQAVIGPETAREIGWYRR
jgi:hypothetical protein